MHRIVDNSIGLKAAAAMAIVAWLFASSATAQEAAGHGEKHAYSGLASDLPFWGIIAFIGFVFALKKLGWGSFTSGLAGREAEEQRLIDEAEGLQRQAAGQLTTHRGMLEAIDEQVREVLAEAERDADHTRRDIRSVADREAAIARARADLEISRVKDQTLNDLFEAFSQQVINATQQKLHGGLNPAAQDQLIDEALAGFAQSRPRPA